MPCNLRFLGQLAYLPFEVRLRNSSNSSLPNRLAFTCESYHSLLSPLLQSWHSMLEACYPSDIQQLLSDLLHDGDASYSIQIVRTDFGPSLTIQLRILLLGTADVPTRPRVSPSMLS